jgi:hypothetical protein
VGATEVDPNFMNNKGRFINTGKSLTEAVSAALGFILRYYEEICCNFSSK